jgi:catalase
VPRYIGARLGEVRSAEGTSLPVEVTVETTPSVLFDACCRPAAEAMADALAIEFVQLQYRHW